MPDLESKETDSILFSNNDDEIGHISEISNCESSDDCIINQFCQTQESVSENIALRTKKGNTVFSFI